ncbi:hypothetical protein DCAR_0622868 [Daucus carota subsp. sativus]|uniref:Leo1-like protein n=1 Tax=Daucus carota subsp. sativus TaxID=79200 RepID=A0AAF1B2A2_DAUCS|nr:PREDICTED: protein LEO1 homolog [Daucus carota subsp. sativus]WOH03470.1 hypothetical protein DCAR_0622868 [Daucus carota subsp. sativus]
MVGEEKRHQMMQNLFGDQSEEEDDDEEVESEHESNRQPVDYASDEGDGGMEPEVEGEAEVEGQGEVEAEMESDGDLHDADPVHGESEAERDQSSQEVEVGDQREESEGKDFESDDQEDYRQRVVTSKRRNAIESGSERFEENRYAENEDEEVEQTKSQRSPGEDEDEAHISHTAPELRDVFGDSDDEEPEYAVENQIDHDSNRSPIDEEGSYEKGLRPEDMVADEEGQYESEEENIKAKHKERPVGPPLELGIPLRPPPARPEKMNIIKVSNIMGIDPKPFDPETYVEEDEFVTDESGSKKRIRLENNIVRWRNVKNPDGTITRESNARFIRWSDGSLQLQIGNEVLDISVQDARHDQAHLFLRHDKGILQSQGRLLQKMRFMPSSLTSKSHRMLTALVDSRHKKVYKVKNCVTDIDPEREKEQKERAESQTIRANELLSRKKEKVNRKYTQTVRRERQLSPGFLEDALEEDDEPDYYESRRSAPRRRFDDDMEMEDRAEKRILSAKKGHKDIPRKSFPASKSSRRPVDFSDSEKEESEYETDGEEEYRSPARRMTEDPELDDEEEEENYEEEAGADEASEEEEPKHKAKESQRNFKHKEIESDDDSPKRKPTTHRRMAVVYDSDED